MIVIHHVILLSGTNLSNQLSHASVLIKSDHHIVRHFDRLPLCRPSISTPHSRFAMEHVADTYLEVVADPDELESDHHTADDAVRGTRSDKKKFQEGQIDSKL